MKALQIDKVGVQAIVVDLGRRGYARYGVSRSGPFDLASWQAANIGAGNQNANLAAVEIVLGPFRATALGAVTVCVAGAPAVITVGESGDTVEYSAGQPIALSAGQRISIGRANTGLRIYLAIHGGFEVARTLGSASYDTVSTLGPAPLRAGDELAVFVSGIDDQLLSVTASLNRSIWRQMSELTGKGHFDQHLPAGFGRRIDQHQWVVQPDSNRAGVRLHSPDSGPVEGVGQRPSAPTMTGSIQLLPSGDLVVFGPDCPTTGGYPVIGVLNRSSIDQVGQARPGAKFMIKLDD